MTMQTLPAPVVSRLPRDAHHRVPVAVVADRLAAVIDGTRYADVRIETAVAQFLETHQISLPGGVTPARLTDGIMLRVFADQVYDSEYNQALRAATAVLTETFSSGSLQAAGWLRGFEVSSGWETHRLTGEACPRCEINPECFSPGGGTHCFDTTGCRWMLCF